MNSLLNQAQLEYPCQRADTSLRLLLVPLRSKVWQEELCCHPMKTIDPVFSVHDMLFKS